MHVTERAEFNLTDFDQLGTLLMSGFEDWKKCGEVNIRYDGDLALFNYTDKAQYAGRWNWFERVSRGLIMNRKTGQIVARPFDKFFNWLEGGRRATGHIVTVTEKLDGSLGVAYRSDSGYKIATRGSFDSEQAKWATLQLGGRYFLDDFPEHWTLMFEIIYPENRIVVDYGKREALVLLAIRDIISGDYVPFFPDVYEIAEARGWQTPKVFAFNDLTTIIERTGIIGADEEGYVVEFSDGQRFKFKGDRYRELHRLISGLTYKNTVKALQAGTIDYIRSQVPEEMLADFDGWLFDINTRVMEIGSRVRMMMAQAPRDDRKTFALWVRANCQDISALMFRTYDGQSVQDLVYKQILEEAKDEI